MRRHSSRRQFVNTPLATPLVAPLATLQGALSTVQTCSEGLQLHSSYTPLLYFYTDENMPSSQKTVTVTVSMSLKVFINHLIMVFQIIRSLSILYPVQPLTQRC